VIEFILIFALGALCAGLLFLLSLPLLWRRAVRLSTRRLEMQLPLSMQEIYAERDQVRAQAAVDQRQIELKLERSEQEKAQLMADVGKKMNETALAQQEITALRRKLEEMERGLVVSSPDDAQRVREEMSRMGHNVLALTQALEAELGTAGAREALKRAQALEHAGS
jgi:hypothetical protein